MLSCKRCKSMLLFGLRKTIFYHRQAFNLLAVFHEVGKNYVGHFFYLRFKKLYKRYKTGMKTSTDWLMNQTRYRYMDEITSLQSYHDKLMYQKSSLTWSLVMETLNFMKNELSYLSRKSKTDALLQNFLKG